MIIRNSYMMWWFRWLQVATRWRDLSGGSSSSVDMVRLLNCVDEVERVPLPCCGVTITNSGMTEETYKG